MDFLKVFYAPGEVKYSKKKWIYFFIVSLVIGLLVLFLNVHFNFNGILNAVKERLSSVSEEQKAQALNMLTFGRMMLRGGISLLIWLPLKLLFIAGMLYVIRMLWETENFSIPLFASSIYIYIQTVGDFIKFLLSVIFNTFPFTTDLSILTGSRNFLFGFLSAFDIFTIYAMYVAGVVISPRDKKRSMYYFFVLLVLLILWGIIKGFTIRMGMK